MNKVYIILFALFTSLGLHTFSQSIERFVISSAGDSYSDGSYTIDWTIGETVIGTLDGSKKQLSQGFHQDIIVSSTLSPMSNISDQIKENFVIFPNPFLQNICIKRQGKEKLSITLYNTAGKLVYRTMVGSDEQSIMLSLPNLTQAAYILNINDNNSINESTVVIKKQ